MFVYIIRDYYWNYKIWLTNNLIRRLDFYKLHHARPLSVICVIKSNNARIKEKELHTMFKWKWISWEWFMLDDSDINKIKELNKDLLLQIELDNINNYLWCYHYNNFSIYSKEEEICNIDLEKTIWLLE